MKEDIEAAGFIYEPDETKCKPRKIRCHFDCNYYESGSWTNQTTPDTSSKEWKDYCIERMVSDAYYWSHIHDVFVTPIAPLSGKGVMCRWVWISGHGTELTKRWYPTGMLEGLKPKQMPEASKYLHRVAQELIDVAKYTKDSPEEKRWDNICGIALPVARMIFDKYPIRPDPKFLVEDVVRFFDENKELYDACNSYICEDGDRQLQQFYMEKFIWKE